MISQISCGACLSKPYHLLRIASYCCWEITCMISISRRKIDVVEVKIEDLDSLHLNLDSPRLRQPGEPVALYWIFVFVHLDFFWY